MHPFINHPHFRQKIASKIYFADESGTYILREQPFVIGPPYGWSNVSGNHKRLSELPLWFRELFEEANRMYYADPQKDKLRGILEPKKKRPIKSIVMGSWALSGLPHQEGWVLEACTYDDTVEYTILKPIGGLKERMSGMLKEYDYEFEIQESDKYITYLIKKEVL